ncbi:hypothetical protein N7495_003969 [Penicillium taxi]|uniref:uncharacterized protein n=1 Tax=Penicillium taxi TaxID=168475 RepID=UPI0025458E70|nr:uncharacterized protein N7495_003969 [Penicillium taxi]KAJ5899225.1 hypothetical protein N7495_003969 [Penicillium taxi]
MVASSANEGPETLIDAGIVARTPGRKRQASSPPPLNKGRQKITRACDSCKVKKTKCTGTLPCTRCTRLLLQCRYNAAYSRGLPPDPLPSPAPDSRHTSDVSKPLDSRGGTNLTARDTANAHEHLNSHVAPLRHSPEPGFTDFEGNYIGPSSGISFINRVWGRLNHQARLPNELQNESSINTAVFMFGDKPYSNHEHVNFILPSFDKAMEFVAIYFDFSMVTYRFLHRGNVENWVKQVYDHNISVTNLPVGNMVARTAIVLMILAVSTLFHQLQPGDTLVSGGEQWFMASKYMSSLESGPPRLETIQLRLIQCLYLLSTSRANECWYSFGTALQVVTALGLHRKWPVKLSKYGGSCFESEMRKRIFWSVYTLDKYLSIMFGRPRLLHDEDIDQELPEEMNDEDLLEEDPARRSGSTDSMMIASVLHYRLGRILGEISRQLYSIKPHSRETPLETAARLTSELERWKESVPPLFNSVRPSSLIPPLCRQSQVLQMAYSHAMIHVTRSFLLNDFTDLSRRPRDPHPMISAHVQKCIGAAEEVMTLVEGLAQQRVFIQSFWFTHYVCFCAILVVYIHIIQQHRQSTAPSPSGGSPANISKMQALFALAESCQQYLAEATRKNCPSRRYSIILEELRREVHRQIGSDDRSKFGQVSAIRDHAATMLAISHEGGDSTASFADNIDLSIPEMLPASELGSINPVEDAGFFENLEGSIWWAQLDSWALSNFPNDTSTFTI